MAKEPTLKDVADSVENLATIVKDEFEKASNERKEMRDDIKTAAVERKEMKRDIQEIKMKMGYVAWQIDMEEMKGRVAAIEKKIGIKSKS